MSDDLQALIAADEILQDAIERLKIGTVRFNYIPNEPCAHIAYSQLLGARRYIETQMRIYFGYGQ